MRSSDPRGPPSVVNNSKSKASQPRATYPQEEDALGGGALLLMLFTTLATILGSFDRSFTSRAGRGWTAYELVGNAMVQFGPIRADHGERSMIYCTTLWCSLG